MNKKNHKIMLIHATIKQHYLHIIARILGEPHAGERGFKLRLCEANKYTHKKGIKHVSRSTSTIYLSHGHSPT